MTDKYSFSSYTEALDAALRIAEPNTLRRATMIALLAYLYNRTYPQIMADVEERST